MSIKQKLTVGIAAIFMLTLTIVGVSYAYFVTRVQGTTTTNVEIITAQYGVEYGQGSNIVSLNNALPGDEIYKMFTVTNKEKAPSTYQITLTQTPGDTEFLHAKTGGADTNGCYADAVTKNSKQEECYSGENYDDLKVTLVEYTGSDPDLKGEGLSSEQTKEDQTKLKQAFDSAISTESSKGKTIQTETQLTAKTGDGFVQNLGDKQTIEGKTDDGADVVKVYILKVKFDDAKKNQSSEMSASVDIKIDLV